MLNQPGKPPVPMTIPQVAEMLTKQGEMLSKQDEQIHTYERRIAELENINRNLQKLILEKTTQKDNDAVHGSELPKSTILQDMKTLYGPKPPVSKSDPLFKLDATMI
jgi:transcription initiation factor IIF auxiliary subunit